MRESVSEYSSSSKRMTRCCCCRMPNKGKALIATIIPFGLITVLQFFAAIMANSTALLVDCGSMLVDVLTYVGNLWALCSSEDGEESVRSSLISSGISLLVLYGITLWGVIDSVKDLMQKSQDIPDDLNPQIVLLFGIGGLLFDGIALFAFRSWGIELPALDRSVIELVDAGEFSALSSEESQNLDDQVLKRSSSLANEASLVNMFSALSHVIADTVRSLSSIALGIIVMADSKLNGSSCDDFATLVVATTIVLGSLSLVFDWLQIFRKYISSPDPTPQSIEEEQAFSPRISHDTTLKATESTVQNPFSIIFKNTPTATNGRVSVFRHLDNLFSPRNTNGYHNNGLSSTALELMNNQQEHSLPYSDTYRYDNVPTTNSPTRAGNYYDADSVAVSPHKTFSSALPSPDDDDEIESFSPAYHDPQDQQRRQADTYLDNHDDNEEDISEEENTAAAARRYSFFSSPVHFHQDEERVHFV